MYECEGAVDFVLLAMCQNPLRGICDEIAANAHVLGLITRRLGDLPGSTPEVATNPELPVFENFPEYCVTPEMVSEAPVPEIVRPMLSLLGAIPAEGEPAAPDPGEIISVPRGALLPALKTALGVEPELPTTETIELTPSDVRGHLESLAAVTLIKQNQAIEGHAWEAGSLSTDLERVEGRRKDYTPAIHAWLKILAEKGVLEQIAE